MKRFLLDRNVVVRFLLGGVSNQGRAAASFFAKSDRQEYVLILEPLVLAETVILTVCRERLVMIRSPSPDAWYRCEMMAAAASASGRWSASARIIGRTAAPGWNRRGTELGPGLRTQPSCRVSGPQSSSTF